MNVQFETPENILISYRPAGFASRFIAYMIDQIVFLTLYILFFVAVSVMLLNENSIVERLVSKWMEDDLGITDITINILLLMLAGLTLANSLMFTLMELLMHGRTVGKKIMGLRVVKKGGFSLNLLAVFLRNFMRLVDCALLLPPIMSPTIFVAFASDRRERLGDLLAGTMVVHDKVPAAQELLDLRAELEKRPPEKAVFRADGSRLMHLPRQLISAAEKSLQRWQDIPPAQQTKLLDALLRPLALKAGCRPPAAGEEMQFLADILAGVYRQEYRRLG